MRNCLLGTHNQSWQLSRLCWVFDREKMTENADDVMGVFAGSLDIAKKRNGMTPTQDAAAAITYVERMRSAVLVKSGE